MRQYTGSILRRFELGLRNRGTGLNVNNELKLRQCPFPNSSRIYTFLSVFVRYLIFIVLRLTIFCVKKIPNFESKSQKSIFLNSKVYEFSFYNQFIIICNIWHLYLLYFAVFESRTNLLSMNKVYYRTFLSWISNILDQNKIKYKC